MDAESGANHFAENRSHIRELYDTFGQVLSYVNMQRNILKDLVNNNQIEKLENNLETISKIVEEANNKMRDYI